MGRVLGKGLETRVLGLAVFQLFEFGCSFLENEVPSAFKDASSSQFLGKLYLEHSKQEEVGAGNFLN